MSIHVAHFTKSVIKSPSEGNERDSHTEPLRDMSEGLGNVMWNPTITRDYYDWPSRTLVSARGHDIHTMLVVPQIQSLSSHRSGMLGRQELVIVGSGFAASNGSCAKNTVTLSGVACFVTFCNASQLRCTVGPMNSTGYIDSQPFPSTFGMTRHA